MPASRIENLGQIMGLQLKGPSELISQVRKGLTPSVSNRLTKAYGISQSDLAQIIHVTAKTIQRQQTKGTYNPVISDALFRLADVFARAKEVFGSENEAREWMHEESTALGNVTPWSLLDTAAGEDMVVRELGRIEHGIVS